jgi:hypothetical protein
MRHLDDRTRLLLGARVLNGVKITVNDEHDRRLMHQMVQEGLFRYSDTMFSEGFWWTPVGERAAEEAWQQTPVEEFETRYRNHPQVRFMLNGRKEELCYVFGPNYAEGRSGLWVREFLGQWLVDHPDGERNERFSSADQAIEWTLAQVGQW